MNSAEAAIEQGEVWQEASLCLTMPVNELIDERAILSQTMRFAGSVLLDQVVEISDVQPINSLMDALHLASAGDTEATNLVRANVATDLMERTIKAGFVSDSHMEIAEDGRLMQHGQSYQSVQANSLRYVDHPVMRARVWAETKNCFRLEQLVSQGVLNEYSFVVFSLAEADMPEHFFSDTKTLTIQVSTKVFNELSTQIAFIAGKDESGREHDISTVAQIIHTFSDTENEPAGASLTVEDTTNLSNAELLDQPWLIHNNLLPNGVSDLVKLYDDLAGGTFYGQNQPREDYQQHLINCRLRTQNYNQACNEITNQLIAEADILDSPVSAARRLDELSRSYSLSMAILSDSIDPQVFGPVSAGHIIRAREALMQGDRAVLNHEIIQAKRFDMSTSCPGATSSIISGPESRKDSSSDTSKSDQEDKYGSLTFYCSKGHLNNRPKNRLIDRCKVCKISVKCS